ncbi:MAG: Trk family potassium uptake protein [Erysipelotrichaceae bacterium]|nr:Trk family potassium uptake protein [Erysipelotrichaceae bacterium]
MDKIKKLSPVKIISLGYLITILVGTLLLMLPIASKDRQATSFIDSFFVSTSATCVTGLTPFDTYTHWSLFGQIVILILIQIGGLGFMTIITLVLMMLKKNIGLYNRTILMQSAGSYNISDMGPFIKRIIKGTLLFEGLGTIILALAFSKDMSFGKALYYGLFHSISAFCNAGFDIMGSTSGSLVGYSNNPIVLITIMFLIVIGGLGFVVWSDILDTKFNFKKMQLHTKIVLVFSGIIIIVPAFLFFILEFTAFGQAGAYQDLSFGQKILNSFFLSISPRTAGFYSLDLNNLTSSGKLLTMILMFIGGNSGSTAGGIKITTFIVVLANIISSARGKDNVVIFKRRVSNQIIKQSSSLFVTYLVLVLIGVLVIAAVEPFTLEQVLFEVISALGTVGLSLGVSAQGMVVTKIVLILLMYAGRLGAVTLLSFFVEKRADDNLIEPKGKMLVG